MSISSSSRALAYLALLAAIAYGSARIVDLPLAPDRRLSGFEAVRERVEVVSLGPSHSRAFHFPAMGLEGYALNGSGMGIETSALKLKSIASHSPALTCVLMPISPGVLSLRDSSMASRQRGWLANTPTYLRAPDLSLRDRARIATAKLTNLPQLTLIRESGPHLRDRVSHAIEPGAPCRMTDPTGLSQPDEFGLRHGYPPVNAPAACHPEMARLTAATHLSRLPPEGPWRDRIQAGNLALLDEMLNLLAAQDAHLVLVATPTTRFYRAEMAQLGSAEIDRVTETFGDRANFHFIDAQDFFDDHPDPATVFYDDDHLSRTGAEIFSRALRPQIPFCGATALAGTEAAGPD